MKAKTVFQIMILFFALVCGVPNIHAQIPVNCSSFLGGSGDDSAQAVAVAPDGCIWVCGYTCSADFPLVNPIDSTLGGSQDGFVSKFSPDGSICLFSTYLGGSAADLAMGIAVDGDGNVYVCGYTDSADFPTLNAFQPTRNGFWTDMFICKLNAAGAMIYSSYLGGSMFDYAHNVAVDASGCAYVAGRAWSTDFPTVNAFQTTNGNSSGYNFTLTKVAADGASLVYSTYLGGTGAGHEYPCVDVTPGGIACFGGATTSTDYPVTPNAYQPVHAGPSPGSWDGVVSIFSADGSSLTYSTFLGGSEDIDQITDIAVGADGAITVTGITQSNNFPVVNPIQPAISGQPDYFVTKFNPAGDALVFSTYLGGWDWDYGQGVAVGDDGSVVVVGIAVSTNFPVFEAFQPAKPGGYDCTVSRLSPDGSVFVYSTYLGGSGSDFGYRVALDAGGNAIVVGRTASSDFPTVNPFQSTRGGGDDGFVARLAKTPYCDADGGCTEYISRVQFNTIDNSSNCGGYQDFTAFSTDIELETDHTITVTNGAAIAGDLCDVWVDWNQNGSFADAGESTTLGGGPAEFTGTITAPANALPGETRMRIRLRQGGSVDPCGNFANGEVEDYTVIVVGTYTVTYDANGATSGTAPADQSKTHGVDLTLATNTGTLAKTGHTFNGWNTNTDGSGTHYDAGATYTANAALTLYAQWTLDTYTVTYNANGATSGTAPADQTKTYGVDLTLATNTGTLARTGHAFNGWNTATDGSGTHYDAGATYTADAALALYAQWTPCTAIISPENSDHAPEAATGQTVTVTINGGCSWTATSNASWITITNGASGTGSGTVTYSLTENGYPNQPRTGTITIAGQTCTVTQGSSDSTFTEGPGAGCEIEVVRDPGGPYILYMNSEAAGGTLPPNTSFPWGLFDFKVVNVPLGGTVRVTITTTNDIPAGSTFYKYDAGTGTYTPYANVEGMEDGDNQFTLILTDGGEGDQDGFVNGETVDPGNVGVLGKPIPTLSEGGIIMFVLLLAGMAIVLMRRRKDIAA